MKIYLDGANLEQIKEYESIIDGITTNPSLMKRAGITNYKDFALKVLELTDKPVSFEILSDDLNEMERQARIVSSWGDNVYVKIPIVNTKNETTIPLIKKLSKEIKINVTAVLTINQIKNISDIISYKQSNIISIFMGRIADTGRDPIPIMKYAKILIDYNNINTELLWASVREIYNFYEAQKCGCDIITIPLDILNKKSLYNKNLEELSLETVKQFYQDGRNVEF